jgi:hypothetical protein
MQNTRKAEVAWAQRPSRWESLRPWLFAVLWIGGLALGFGTTECIEDAYENACLGQACVSIDGAIQLLRYSIILNAFAVPAAIMFMRRPSGRPTRDRN